MANTFTTSDLIPRVLAQALDTLTTKLVAVRTVNTTFQKMAGQKGSTVDVPVPSAITVSDVTPALTHPAATNITGAVVAIPIDKHKEAPFILTDVEKGRLWDGVKSMEVADAAARLANQVDQDVWANYKHVPNYVGTAGTAPFGTPASPDPTVALTSRETLTRWFAPDENRSVIVNGAAAVNALALSQFNNSQVSGNREAFTEGTIGRKLGADWYETQNVPYHTLGANATGLTVNGAHSVGSTTLSMAKTASSNWAAAVGDVFSIAGDPQTYIVATAVTVTASANTTVTIFPTLQTAMAGTEAITVKASHRVNMLFHRDAFAFVSRPFENEEMPGVQMAQMTDPKSGISIRFEINRLYKQTRYSLDFQYGSYKLRPELACRIAG